MEERLTEQKQHWNNLAGHYDTFFHYETKEGKRKVARKVKQLCDLGKITADSVILEIGCGTGRYTLEFVKKAKAVYAIDLSEKMLERAPKMNNVVYRCADAHKLPYADNCFDVVVGCYVLQYLELDKALSEFVRVLKPEGRVIFIEPNALNPIAFVITRWGIVRRLLHRPTHNTSFFSWELKNTFEHYQIDVNTKSLEFTTNIAFASDIINRILAYIPVVNKLGGSLIVYGRK